MTPMLVTARNGLFATAAVLLATGAAQASTVTVNLGLSSQDYFNYGTGPVVNPPGHPPGTYGTYTLGQGSGTYDSVTNTSTFILSGSVTGSTSPLYSSGTYQFITTYPGPDSPNGGPNAPRAISSTPDPGSNANFSHIHREPGTSVVLDLSNAHGSFIIPLVMNGIVDANVSNITFRSGGDHFCTGLGSTPCSQAAVGLVNGSTEFGPVTITVEFSTPTPTPLPSAWAMMLGGLGVIGFVAYRRGKTASIPTHA